LTKQVLFSLLFGFARVALAAIAAFTLTATVAFFLSATFAVLAAVGGKSWSSKTK
jgi:hypothetical protein